LDSCCCCCGGGDDVRDAFFCLRGDVVEDLEGGGRFGIVLFVWLVAAGSGGRVEGGEEIRG